MSDNTIAPQARRLRPLQLLLPMRTLALGTSSVWLPEGVLASWPPSERSFAASCAAMEYSPLVPRWRSSDATLSSHLLEPARDDTHPPRPSSPYGSGGEDTAAHGDPERAHVVPGEVVQHSRHPGPKSGPDPGGHTQGAEDRAIVATLENLGGNRPVDRGEPVAEKPLGSNHHVEPPHHRLRVHQQEGRIRAHEPGAAHAPRPLPTDAIGQIPHRDLTRDAREGHEAERPHRGRRQEAHFYEVLGLVNLHAVPGERAGQKPEGNPPEASGHDTQPEGPVDRCPGGIDDAGARIERQPGVTGRVAVGRRAD